MHLFCFKLTCTGLEGVLQQKLFGQHIVSETVLAALEGHLSSPDPPKPLVLSFHGRTGTGKNFVSRLIAESIYYEGNGQSICASQNRG